MLITIFCFKHLWLNLPTVDTLLIRFCRIWALLKIWGLKRAISVGNIFISCLISANSALLCKRNSFWIFLIIYVRCRRWISYADLMSMCLCCMCSVQLLQIGSLQGSQYIPYIQLECFTQFSLFEMKLNFSRYITTLWSIVSKSWVWLCLHCAHISHEHWKQTNNSVSVEQFEHWCILYRLVALSMLWCS